MSSGGDDGCGPKIKEMQDLRVAFEGIVSERKKLQSAKKGRADNPPNPFYSVHLDIERPATSPLPPWQARASTAEEALRTERDKNATSASESASQKAALATQVRERPICRPAVHQGLVPGVVSMLLAAKTP